MYHNIKKQVLFKKEVNKKKESSVICLFFIEKIGTEICTYREITCMEDEFDQDKVDQVLKVH